MIEFKNISFKYKGAKSETLQNISFKINRGEVLAIVGPSGGGKSTVLRVLSGLELPHGGEVLIDGQVVQSQTLSLKAEKRGVGMVFQEYALFPHMTVQKNIEFGIDRLPKRERYQRVLEVLQLVALEGYEKRFPHELSGGQQQRIALARALVVRPKVLLLDEPFSNLDTQLLEQVRQDLMDIIIKAGMTTIMVTHNPEDAHICANKILTIVDGQVV